MIKPLKGELQTGGGRERRENQILHPGEATLKIIRAKEFLCDLCVLCGEML
jgi:hypothetical protein